MTESVSVLIDATAIPRDRGGVGRYVDALAAHLERPFHLVCQAYDVDYYRAIAPAASVVAAPASIGSAPRRLIWEQLGLPRLAKRLRVDVIHSPHYTTPLFTRRARVVNFHDATFFSDPGVHTRLKRAFFRSWIRLSSRLADVIITGSQSAASELARYTSRPASSFVVIVHAADPVVFHLPTETEVAAFRAEHLLGDEGWIAFLGTLEPRKNLPALVAAYAQLARRRSALPPLVLAGGRGWDTRLDDAVASVPAPGRVERLGFIAVDQLRAFLGGSTLVAYPSLGEGFGLPVLEGMACGATVLTTRELSLPEVGGDAVEYTGTDAASIARSIAALLDDPARRQELAAAGFERAQLFSWNASARAHETVYASLVPQGRL